MSEENRNYCDDEFFIPRHRDADDIVDYNPLVNAYKKTFPTKKEVMEQTPDPAVRQMLKVMEEKGIETSFDRFEKQHPQCNFGMAGICCKICYMGPCRITPKSPRGVCGADADLIAARNLLRIDAAGTAQHGMHAREVILSLKWAGEGKLKRPILGADKLMALAKTFNLETEGKTVNEVAVEFANVLLRDLSRPEGDEEFQTIKYMAHPERLETYKKLGILPISTYHEVFESMHNSGEATDGDYRNILKQLLRTNLTYVFGTVVDTNLATDCLFGVGDRCHSDVNLGTMDRKNVNLVLHGHLPTLVSEVVRLADTEEFQNMAKAKGAEGIQLYGVCCTGLSAMYRYGNVPPLSNPPGAELVLATGAVDLWMADVQDIYPGIMNVARCMKTKVITTSDSTRLPGAEHIAFDHAHTNIEETEAIARKILTKAIESYEYRREIPSIIPPYKMKAEMGFSPESLTRDFGGSLAPLAEALQSGQIRGIVSLVGCTNPKTIYEKCIVDVATELLKNNYLIITNGCASFPLLKLGFCNTDAIDTKCGEGLKAFLKKYSDKNLPPVWHVGECVDNTRTSGILGGVAGICDKNLPQMPYAMTSPEWSNEKGFGAAFSYRLLGINTFHCVEPQVFGSENVMRFLKEDTKDLIGSVMTVNTDPIELAKLIMQSIEDKRKALGWD